MKRQLMLTLLLGITPALAAPAQEAQVKLSLIEAGPRPTSEKDPNRRLPFVELRHMDGREREYSVPFAPELQAREVVADQTTTWGVYQDTLHWAMQVGVNNDVTSIALPGQEHALRFPNCTLQIPADITIALGQALTGKTWITRPAAATVEFGLSNPTPQKAGRVVGDVFEGWRDDRVNLDAIAVPRVGRETYCPYSSTDLFPDELEGIYNPSIQACFPPFGCYTPPNFPAPDSVNYPALIARLKAICDPANTAETARYQTTNLESVAKNLPLAIHWTGVMTPDVDGLGTGTTMSPVWSPDPSRAAKSVTDAAQADARLPAYLLGKLPSAAGFTPTAAQPGIPKLETLKRYLYPGSLGQAEKGGYASFFQTWQRLDLVPDTRPLIYWAKGFSCTYFSCVPVPYPVLLPSAVVTSTPALKDCTFTSGVNTGLTTINALRFHWGLLTVPEGYDVPNLKGTPVARPGTE